MAAAADVLLFLLLMIVDGKVFDGGVMWISFYWRTTYRYTARYILYIPRASLVYV